MTKRKIERIAILCCAVSFVFASGVSAKIYNSYEASKNKLKNTQENLAALRQEIENVRESIEMFKKDKEEFEKYFFSEKDVPAFLEGISKYAQKAEVDITDMKTKKFSEVIVPYGNKNTSSGSRRSNGRKSDNNSEASSEKELKRMLTLAAMPISIKTEGTFGALMQFLEHLESFDQLVNISNVKIAVGRQYPRLECGFTLKIYSLKNLSEVQ